MRRRLISLTAVLMLLLALPVQAAETRAVIGFPRLSIRGTTATCAVDCNGKSTDKISVTLTLYQGAAEVDSWSDSGTGSVSISETCTVKTGKTYKLTLSATANGVEKPDVSVTANS